MSSKSATTSPLFFFLHNLISHRTSKMDSTKQSRTRNAVDPTQLCHSLSPTVASAACSVTSPTPPSGLVHAREEQQLLAQEEIGQELVSISGQFRTTTDINHVLASSSISSPTAASPPAAPKTSPISPSFSYTAKNISVTKPIWPTKTWAHGKKPSAPPTPPQSETNKKPNRRGNRRR